MMRKIHPSAAGLSGIYKISTVFGRGCYSTLKGAHQACAVTVTPHFLLEPCGSQTALVSALAAPFAAENWGLQATLLVLQADHLIADLVAFAIAVAQAKALVTG